MISFSIQTDEALRHMQDMKLKSAIAEDVVLDVGRVYSQFISSFAPKKTGWMAMNASEIVHQKGANSITVGVGPFSKLGYPTDSAMPKGQIASFIAANPSLRGSPPDTPRGAWWTLAKAGKDKLQSERMGRKPRYWQAIQEQRVPTQDGGILNTAAFISVANSVIQSYISRIQRLLR